MNLKRIFCVIRGELAITDGGRVV